MQTILPIKCRCSQCYRELGSIIGGFILKKNKCCGTQNCTDSPKATLRHQRWTNQKDPSVTLARLYHNFC